jgi:hypothetical protein
MPSDIPPGGSRGFGTRASAFVRAHRLWTLLIAALAVGSVTIGVLSLEAWPIHPLTHGSHGFSTDIEIDSHGNVHLILPMGRLYYATNAHGGWSVSLLDDVHEVWDAALAKDSNDRMHVAYAAVLREGGVEVGSPSIRYVLLDGKLQVSEVIDANGRYPAIAVDSMDRVHVTYVAWTFGALKHATSVGGTWVNTTADTRYPVAIYSAVAVDSKGAAHVAFTGFSESEIGYATNEGGNWRSESLETDGLPNLRVPIAIDKTDRVHVAYLGCLDGCERKAIFHAVQEQGAWARTVVASGVTNEGNNLDTTLDLELEPSGRPHLLFNDRADATLFYAAPAGEGWVTRIVDRGTLWVLGGSLALGGDGRVAIAYYRLDGGGTDTGTSARVALSGVRWDNLLDFLWGVSLYLIVEAVAFAATGFILWRRARRSELSGGAVRG